MKPFAKAREVTTQLKDKAMLTLPLSASVAMGVGVTNVGIETLSAGQAASVISAGCLALWGAAALAERAADHLRGWKPAYAGGGIVRKMGEHRIASPENILGPFMGGVAIGAFASDAPLFTAVACVAIVGYSCKHFLKMSQNSQQYLEVMNEAKPLRRVVPPRA